MKCFLFFLFISLNAWSADRLKMVFDESQIKQGALVKGTLFVPPAFVNLPVQKLKGENVSETIFFQQISPLFRKDGSEAYSAEVTVIFTNVPQSSFITTKIGSQEVILEWNDLSVIPVEATGQMLWASFTAPDFFEKSLSWILWILGILIFAGGGAYFFRKFSLKAREKKRRLQVAQEVRSCTSYEEVVNFWKKKRSYLKDFPHLENTFPSLESVLFKYSFKPTQTESEKDEVMKAYRRMMEESEGGFRGI